MAVLTGFETPGRLAELSDADRDAWSETVVRMVRRFAARFPQFYDPTATDTPDGLAPTHIGWSAFPARVLREEGSGPARWARADADRREQDEYCEWSVERDAAGTITRITFTTEAPEYWQHVATHDRARLLEL